MARRLLLKTNVGERLLSSKLQILQRTGVRRPSVALSILTGRVAEQLSILENFYADDPAVSVDVTAMPVAAEMIDQKPRPNYQARTVYLSDQHLSDIDSMIELLSKQLPEPKRVTRSAVLRRAVEHLRIAVETDPAKSFFESE